MGTPMVGWAISIKTNKQTNKTTQRIPMSSQGYPRTVTLVVVAHHCPHLHLLHLLPVPLLLGFCLPVLGIHRCHPRGLRLSLPSVTVIPDEGLVVHIAHSQKLGEAWAWL